MPRIVAIEAVAGVDLLGALSYETKCGVEGTVVQRRGRRGPVKTNPREGIGDPISRERVQEALDEFGAVRFGTEHLASSIRVWHGNTSRSIRA
jgi:hypothetical protein